MFIFPFIFPIFVFRKFARRGAFICYVVTLRVGSPEKTKLSYVGFGVKVGKVGVGCSRGWGWRFWGFMGVLGGSVLWGFGVLEGDSGVQ